jgi:hypothetical protein
MLVLLIKTKEKIKMIKNRRNVMEITKKAIEMTGRINAEHNLVLDEPLPVIGPTRVRVIILLPEEADIDEKEWLRAVSSNPAFDFLKKPEEDVYSLSDGKPFNADR